MIAFVFPGQGTQHVGMARQWFNRPESRAVFENASDLLGYDVTARCFRGPPAELTETRFAQPAIFTCNAAALTAAKAAGLEPDAVAGHSVGEFSALLAAGALNFVEALRAVARRAELMASIPTAGTMAAVVGLPAVIVEALCRDAEAAGPIGVGLQNGPEFIVVSGAEAAVERVCVLAREAGAVRVMQLAVSHAFHSPLMAPIHEGWAEFVADLDIRPPSVPVLLNTTGALATGVDDIRRAMIDQLTNTVRWVACVEGLLVLGVDVVIEVGDSKALTSLNRRIAPSLRYFNLLEPGSLERVVRTLDADGHRQRRGFDRVVR